MKQRLIYPDAIKFFAIFFVTMEHCSQSIAGQPWTNMLGGTEWDVAFLMPLFMMISGWFINIDKLRDTPLSDFVISKFKRLIVPALSIYIVARLTCWWQPSRINLVNAYWYLFALFASLCIIAASTKIFKSNAVCIATSVIFVMLCPYMWYSKINFMLPFIWAGYGARRLLNSKYKTFAVVGFFIMAVFASLVWNKDYSIYVCPWDILKVSWHSLFIYLYRFVAGFAISLPLIYLFQRYESTKFVIFIAKYGKYSLVIYTCSMLLNSLFKDALNFIHWHNNMYGIIEILSFVATLVIVVITIQFANLCKKNKYTAALFLGE